MVCFGQEKFTKIHCFEKRHNTVTCPIEVWHSDGVIGFGQYEWRKTAQGLLRFDWTDLNVYRPAHWIFSEEK